MPKKPCSCSFGHRYFRSEAEQLKFVCDKDGRPIVCTAEPAPPSPNENTQATGEDEEPKP